MIDACNTHDICYSTCGKTQAECDTEFQNNALKSCSDRYSVAHRKWWQAVKLNTCKGKVHLAKKALDMFGDKAFEEAQNEYTFTHS